MADYQSNNNGKMTNEGMDSKMDSKMKVRNKANNKATNKATNNVNAGRSNDKADMDYKVADNCRSESNRSQNCTD